MEQGEHMLAIQTFKLDSWIATRTRDLIDEADTILSENWEMVFTLGTPVMMDGHPSRWTIAEEFYGLIAKYAERTSRDFPIGVECETRGPGTFPKLRILQDEAGQYLLQSVLDDIYGGAILGKPFWANLTAAVSTATRKFIQDRSASKETELLVRENISGNPKQTVYLLRMLVAYGMGFYPLSNKRVNVDFGQAPFRSLGSVPYLALNTPSPTSDFGHPDSRIVLTIIDYYHNGLTRDQLKDTILILLDTPGREDEWAKWATETNMDLEHRSIRCVNLQHEERYEMFYKHLRFGKAAIDFLLNNKVFPKFGTEYTYKLSKSSEDIPKREGEQLTTGFSATQSILLPQSTKQNDLPMLKFTNGQVLQTLLL